MTASEFREWEEYLSTTPSTQEIQMASLMSMVSGFVFKTSLSSDKFMVAQVPDTGSDILDATADEINKIAGVA